MQVTDSSSLAAPLDTLKDHLLDALDYTELTERLNKGKGHPNPHEKLQLWERLKTLSFTRTVCALWAMTVLNLYTRTRLNIRGRHFFINQARGFANLEPVDQSIALCRQKFLGSVDFLLQYGVTGLIV